MTAMQTTAPEQQLTPQEERNLRAVTDVLDYWNAHDIPGMLTFYDDDIVWTNAAMEKAYRGKDEVGEFLAMLFHALPDLHFEVTHKMVSGDQVSERWHITGTHLGPLMGVPATGRPVDIPGIGMLQMRDGKFLADWFLLDLASVMRQIGVMPPLKVSETKAGQAALWAICRPKLVGLSVGALGAVATLSWLRGRSAQG